MRLTAPSLRRAFAASRYLRVELTGYPRPLAARLDRDAIVVSGWPADEFPPPARLRIQGFDVEAQLVLPR